MPWSPEELNGRQLRSFHAVDPDGVLVADDVLELRHEGDQLSRAAAHLKHGFLDPVAETFTYLRHSAESPLSFTALGGHVVCKEQFYGHVVVQGWYAKSGSRR